MRFLISVGHLALTSPSKQPDDQFTGPFTLHSDKVDNTRANFYTFWKFIYTTSKREFSEAEASENRVFYLGSPPGISRQMPNSEQTSVQVEVACAWTSENTNLGQKPRHLPSAATRATNQLYAGSWLL